MKFFKRISIFLTFLLVGSLLCQQAVCNLYGAKLYTAETDAFALSNTLTKDTPQNYFETYITYNNPLINNVSTHNEKSDLKPVFHHISVKFLKTQCICFRSFLANRLPVYRLYQPPLSFSFACQYYVFALRKIVI